MFTLVAGGAASGKSGCAEELILQAGTQPRFYVATMQIFDDECRARVERHRTLRAGKGFQTLECPMGLSGLRLEEMNMQAFVTIALVMTVGILGGIVCCIFFGKKYLNKLRSAPKKEESKGPGFGAHATTAMFIGLCGAYIGSYVGKAVPREGSDWMPLAVAAIAAAVMAVFEYFIQKRGKAVLENFSLAASMLIAMGLAVAIQMAI